MTTTFYGFMIICPLSALAGCTTTMGLIRRDKFMLFSALIEIGVIIPYLLGV